MTWKPTLSLFLIALLAVIGLSSQNSENTEAQLNPAASAASDSPVTSSAWASTRVPGQLLFTVGGVDPVAQTQILHRAAVVPNVAAADPSVASALFDFEIDQPYEIYCDEFYGCAWHVDAIGPWLTWRCSSYGPTGPWDGYLQGGWNSPGEAQDYIRGNVDMETTMWIQVIVSTTGFEDAVVNAG